MSLTHKYVVTWSVSAGTATITTNNVAISGTFTAPTSFQMNQVFDDVNNDPLKATCTLILQYNSTAINSTDVSNINYEVFTQGLY